MATYDNFAEEFSKRMGDEGDYFHKNIIDPSLYSIIGNLKGKRIYDIGCGGGYMARYFAKSGAEVVASDISTKLIDIAKKKSKDLEIIYHVRDATNFDEIEKNSFDIVTMNMVIHYIKNLDDLFKSVSNILKDEGVFAFTTNHFFRPEYPYSEWVKGKINGEDKLFIKTTNYLEIYKTEVISWWDKKTKMTFYNRPLKEFINKMSNNGLYTFNLVEPETKEFPREHFKKIPNDHHIPTFIAIGAKKLG